MSYFTKMHKGNTEIRKDLIYVSSLRDFLMRIKKFPRNKFRGYKMRRSYGTLFFGILNLNKGLLFTDKIKEP